MSTVVADPLTAALELVSGRRQALQDLETALATVRDVFGQPVAVTLGTAAARQIAVPDAPSAAPPALPAPVRQRRSAKAARVAKAKPAPRKGSEEIEARVLAALERQRAPITVKRLEEVLTLPRTAFKASLARLIQTRAVIRTGTTTSTRLGVPRVMEAAPAPTPWRVPKNPPGQMGRPPVDRDAADTAVLGALAKGPANGKQLSSLVGIHITGVREALQRLVTSGAVDRSGAGPHVRFSLPSSERPPATPESTPLTADRRLDAEIRKVLKTGASQSPREIQRAVEGMFPTIALEDVAGACEDLVKSGAVERIAISDRLKRYRLRPGVKVRGA